MCHIRAPADVAAREVRSAMTNLRSSRSNTQAEHIDLANLALCFDCIDQSVAVVDCIAPDRPLVYVNDAFLRLTGYSAEDVLGQNCRLLQGEDTDQLVRLDIRRLLDEGRNASFTIRNYRKDGTYFLNHISLSPIVDGYGRVTHFLAFQQDVTASSDAHTASRSENEQLRDIVSDSHALIMEMSVPDLAVTFVSDHAEALLGYPLADWKTPGFWADHIHEDDRAAAETLHRSALQERRDHSFEYRFITKAGTTVWLRHASTVKNVTPGVTLAHSVVIDITEAKANERTLREKDAWNTTLLENAPDALLTVDKNFKIQRFNAAAERMFGWPRSELLGRSLDLLVPEEKRPHHTDLARAYLEEPDQGPRTMGDWRTLQGLRRDGTLFPIMIRLARTTMGDRTEVTAIARDMTESERVNRELSALSDRLTEQLYVAEQANRSKSEFLSTMSHELRTPLNAIIGFSEMMHEEVLGPIGSSLYQGYAGDIRRSGQHLLSIINDILDLSRVESGRFDLSISSMNLRMAIRDALRSTRPFLKKAQLKVTTDIAKSLPPVDADPRALHQVLLNLLSNSAKFTDSGGEIKIAAFPDSSGHITITVEDSGVGIPEDILPTLGAPFQKGGSSFDAKNPGSGLGLAISKGLVERMGGRLTIESEETQWTRVSLTLPVCAGQCAG